MDEFDVFIRYNNAITIVHKVTNATSSFLIDIVSARNPFGIDSSVRGENQKSNNTHLTLYSSKGIGYISENGIKDAFQLVNSYKIFMGKVLSGHLGETDENGQVKVISSIIEAKPQEISTDSYLAFGPFNDKNCVANLHKYLRTKFLRFLLLQALTSMNISRGNFRFVPLQNFTNESDIDWYKSVEDIDYQLYTKYHLINEEITFIEKMIKPM